MGGRGRGKRSYGETGFEAWGGYMAAKKSKLEQQFEDTSDKTSGGIFSNVAIFVNGLTDPPALELKEIMLQNGGTYHHYYRSRGSKPTTHIIASNLPHAKIKEHQHKIVVRPEWIKECLQEKKLLDYRPFLLLPPSNPLLSCMAGTAGSNQEQGCSEMDSEGEGGDVDGQAQSDQPASDAMPTKAADDVKAATVVTSSRSPMKRAGEPDFLREFYQKSRLHHISEMKEIFKDYVSRLQDAPDDGHPEREKLRAWWAQNSEKPPGSSDPDPESEDCLPTTSSSGGGAVIAHVDMDCFFVSVGLRTRPELRGKPVAVTHSRAGAEPSARAGENRAAELTLLHQRYGESTSKAVFSDLEGSRAEIASCSYEARAAGVRNGMFVGPAMKLCPDLQTIPYDFAGYRDVAEKMYAIVCGLTRRVQAISCDELLVDCTQLLRDLAIPPLSLAAYIRQAVRRETECPASVGLGPNILLARLATRQAKPDGQAHITPDRALEFIGDLRVSDLPGVGHATADQLLKLGARTCADLRRLELSQLQSQLGPRTGQQLYKFCRGHDDRKLVSSAPRKSVSAEVNYGIRFVNAAEMNEFVNELCAELHSRMTTASFVADNITVKVMVRAQGAPVETSKFMGHGICDTVTRSSRLTSPTSALELIRREVTALLAALHVPPTEVRGLGLQAGRSRAAKSTSSTSRQTELKLAPPPPPPKQAIYTSEQVLRLLGAVGPPPPPPLPDVPTFYGVSEPQLIRRMAAEWLTSASHPERDDVDALTSYLTSLVSARLMEQAYGVLRLIRRRVESSEPWREAVEEITEDVQRVVVQLHGGRLPLPSLPS